MRFCCYCGKGMYSSNENIWVGKVNFDIHSACMGNFMVMLIRNQKGKVVGVKQK